VIFIVLFSSNGQSNKGILCLDFLHSFYVSDYWAAQLKAPVIRHQLCIDDYNASSTKVLEIEHELGEFDSR
jgi:hypothetical protein